MENLTASGVVEKVFRDVRPLFYLELPSTSSFQRLVDVPDYLKQVLSEMALYVYTNPRGCLNTGSSILLHHDIYRGGHSLVPRFTKSQI